MKRKLFLLFLFIFSLPIIAEKRYGLIIGVNYKGNKAKIPLLKFSESDAQYIKSKIQRAGKFDRTWTLLGPQVTKANIKDALNAIANQAGPKDTVFLYFAGHGFYQRDIKAKNGMRNFLVCYDRPHLSDEELSVMLAKIKSPKTLFVIDCCFSGGIVKKGKNTRGSQNIPIPNDMDGVVKQNEEDIFFQNKALISSADDNQTAIELAGTINHGLFTYNLGLALDSADLNSDKVITALEVFFKTREETIKMAREHDTEQEPQVSGDASGIFLSGAKEPIPPKPMIQPEIPKIEPSPEPISDPVKPDPQRPVVTIEEPKTVPSGKTGNLLIKTTIIKNARYASSDQSPYEVGKYNKGNKIRNIKVLIGDIQYPAEIRTVSSPFWGATSVSGKLTPGEVYEILIKDIPAGVHKVTVKADNYPEIQKTTGILPNRTIEMTIPASMSGYGAIKGKVFYKTLDNPISKQPIYMPTITSVSGLHKVYTDQEGNFWFTNLKPGTYEIRASFAEPMKLENAMIDVKEGEVTEVDIILNVKLKSTKTKY